MQRKKVLRDTDFCFFIEQLNEFKVMFPFIVSNLISAPFKKKKISYWEREVVDEARENLYWMIYPSNACKSWDWAGSRSCKCKVFHLGGRIPIPWAVSAASRSVHWQKAGVRHRKQESNPSTTSGTRASFQLAPLTARLNTGPWATSLIRVIKNTTCIPQASYLS